MKYFKELMLFNRTNPYLKYVKGSGINNQYTFLVNTNRYKDLKRGIKWNQTEKSKVKLAIHSPLNVADVKNLGVKIYPGYLTTIRVNMVEICPISLSKTSTCGALCVHRI